MNDKLQGIISSIITVSSSNSFVRYISERIQDNQYRGIHVSQHNRFDLDRLRNILERIYDCVGGQSFAVPSGDDYPGRVSNTDYDHIVDAVKRATGIGTFNSVKKNFFVDFERMGLIARFDSYGRPSKRRGQVASARLTEDGIRLLTSSSILERHKIFTTALDALFANELTNLAETIYYSNYRDDALNLYEFMLILSDNRKDYSSKKIELVDSYRTLTRAQQDKVIELVSEYCQPVNFSGSKRDKRDFSNWKNQTQQIFSLLKSTVYFDIGQNSIRLNCGRYGIFEDPRPMARRISAKQQYFTKHKLDRLDGFELDHIVPFSAARNKHEFNLIDNWQNLVYLSREKHAEKTRNRNKNVVLIVDPVSLSLSSIDGTHTVKTLNGVSSRYSASLAPAMQKFNKEIIESVYGVTGEHGGVGDRIAQTVR